MRADDDGILQALHNGVHESPLWAAFLGRLQARTGARLVSLVCRPLDEDAAIIRHVGDASSPHIQRLFLDPFMGGQQAASAMRPGRAYAMDELFDRAGTDRLADAVAALRPLGLNHMRAITVAEPSGVDLWLACFGGPAIGAATGALLTALAPHLLIALRTFAANERARFRSSVTEQVASRLRMGWFTIDARCRIIEATDNIERMFQSGALLRRGRYDRLVPASPLVDKELTALARRIGAGGEARPQAFVLSRDPWVDMLAAPVPPGAFTGGLTPAAIVYVRGDRRSQADRCEQLVDLFGLLPSEARLAWMLAQATSIADAAGELGLTIETARNYSKKIYAKTGARGHADLVRIIHTSALAIS